MTQYTVKYDLTEKEEEALRELLPCYQQYIAKDGSRPFEKIHADRCFSIADVHRQQAHDLATYKGRAVQTESDRHRSADRRQVFDHNREKRTHRRRERRHMAAGKIKVTEAAALLHVSDQFVRIGMQRGILPIGTALKMSTKWTYQISEKLLAEYSGADVAAELEQIRSEI